MFVIENIPDVFLIHNTKLANQVTYSKRNTLNFDFHTHFACFASQKECSAIQNPVFE